MTLSIEKLGPTLNRSRLLLTHIRKGDYVHPGEEEAIDGVILKTLAFNPALTASPALDVGCGFGGTADYLFKKGFHCVEGLDSDPAAIAYAQNKYTALSLTKGDALNASQLYPPDHFGLITLFNVAYAIEDKGALLKALSEIAKPGAILVLFDYACGKSNPNVFKGDLAGKPMYPICLDDVQKDLQKANWEMLESVDMTQDYIRWYKVLLNTLASESSLLKERFSEEEVEKVRKTFSHLLNQLECEELGGVTIYARKKAS